MTKKKKDYSKEILERIVGTKSIYNNKEKVER
jgi:hypothetical protein